jgi:parallel beta-helix repeat protein
MKNLLIANMLGIFIPNAVSAATYYVNKSGNDSNTCTQAQSRGTAKLTVPAGIRCLHSGDTLIIGPGTYSGADYFSNGPSGGGSWATATTIKAEVARTVTTPAWGVSGSYMIFEGLIVDAAYNENTHSAFFISSGNYIRVENCEIKGGRNHGIISTSGTSFNESINNDVHDNGRTPAGVRTCGTCTGCCHGIYINNDGHLVDGGSYYNNEGYGVHAYSAPTNTTVRNLKAFNNDQGMGVFFGSNNKIYNNIAYGNTRANGIFTSSSSALVANNTAYNNGIGISISGSNNTIRNNIASGNGTNMSSGGSGHTYGSNLCSASGANCAIVESASNTFTNATNNVFTLRSASQAIDKGFNLNSGGVTTDILGVSRPQQGAYDIGAYEFLGAGAGPNPPTNLQVSAP